MARNETSTGEPGDATLNFILLTYFHRRSDSPAKRLERIAGEFNHMLYLVRKAGDLPFVRSLDPVRSLYETPLHAHC